MTKIQEELDWLLLRHRRLQGLKLILSQTALIKPDLFAILDEIIKHDNLENDSPSNGEAAYELIVGGGGECHVMNLLIHV
jgi:hypothetical protein